MVSVKRKGRAQGAEEDARGQEVAGLRIEEPFDREVVRVGLQGEAGRHPVAGRDEEAEDDDARERHHQEDEKPQGGRSDHPGSLAGAGFPPCRPAARQRRRAGFGDGRARCAGGSRPGRGRRRTSAAADRTAPDQSRVGGKGVAGHDPSRVRAARSVPRAPRSGSGLPSVRRSGTRSSASPDSCSRP